LPAAGFLVLVIEFPGSTGEADAAHKVLKARVGAEGIEARTQEDTWIKSFFKALNSFIASLLLPDAA